MSSWLKDIGIDGKMVGFDGDLPSNGQFVRATLHPVPPDYH